MYRKLIKKDIQKSKLSTITIAAFILLAALLTSAAALLIVNLSGSVDHMLAQAKTPHFLQMHTGAVDTERLARFAETQGNVESFQIIDFLNIDGSEIIIGDHSLAGSVQDNGLAVQGEHFDFLLDLDGGIIEPAAGEIYVPLYYRKEGVAGIGDQVTIFGTTFTVAGFLRDSQMNPSLISSKRFLVSADDFERVRPRGMLESLIEFRLTDSADTAAFEAAYLEAGMENNGPPAITHSLFILANAISDGIMIVVLILISMLVIIVTFLCIRFTLLAKIEDDYKEIGVLKAIGLRTDYIKKLYTAKYGAVAAVACLLGFLLALVFQRPLTENIRLYMGESGEFLPGLLAAMAAAALIFTVIFLYVNQILRRFKKISAAEAIRFGAPQEKSKSAKRFCLGSSRMLTTNMFLGIKDVFSRKKLYVTMLMVLIISSFIMIVPQNIYNTISSRNFITYMGVGDCDMRIDVQLTDHIPEKSAGIATVLEQDSNVARYTVLTSMMFDALTSDGSTQRLKVELGDHTVFPISYSGGRAPQTSAEIALSTLAADDLEKAVGEELDLMIDGVKKRLTVCGVYSDITNGGKTAKAIFTSDQADILWSTIPITFTDRSLIREELTKYKDEYTYAKVSNIDDYIEQSFGATITSVKKASYGAVGVTIMLTTLVTLLFMRMLVTKDRRSIAVLKSFGFTSRDIGRQYLTRSMSVLVPGILAGTLLANTLGELVGVAMISSFGASSFSFVSNPLYAYVITPLVIAACVSIATRFGISNLQSLNISDHIKE